MHTRLSVANEAGANDPGCPLGDTWRPNRIATLARQALAAEAELTPKPGLVDRRGPGAHCDLSLELMLRSAEAIEPYFAAMGMASERRRLDRSLRTELAIIGRYAERAMYRVTQGSNTHKGAIWILGLLVAAAARKPGQNAREIAAAAGAIARLPDRMQPELLTHGAIVRARYGAAGARGEATNDFPHVIEFGLPALQGKRATGSSEEVCRLHALLSIMSRLDDTCVLYRGGVEALDVVKSGARAAMMAGGPGSTQGRKEIRKLDRDLITRNVSPGGSADLLAATIFLDAVERRQSEILQDQSEWEESDGAA
jgi:triphosphoribosyl-dephospho-CoA synthase